MQERSSVNSLRKKRAGFCKNSSWFVQLTVNLSLTVPLSFNRKQPLFNAVCIQGYRLYLTGIDVVLSQGCTPQARPWPDLWSQGKEALWTESLSILLEMALRTGTKPLFLTMSFQQYTYTVFWPSIVNVLSTFLSNLEKCSAELSLSLFTVCFLNWSVVPS